MPVSTAVWAAVHSRTAILIVSSSYLNAGVSLKTGMAPAPAGHCPAGHGAKAGHFLVNFYAPLYLPAPAGAGVKKVGHKRGLFQDFRKKRANVGHFSKFFEKSKA